MVPTLWTVRIGPAANTDLKNIVRWTVAKFGSAQARSYAQTLDAALQELRGGPQVLGGKPAGDFAPGVLMLHVARQGRAGRHFVVFRVGEAKGQNVIDVLRILHDSMDVMRHLAPH